MLVSILQWIEQYGANIIFFFIIFILAERLFMHFRLNAINSHIETYLIEKS